MFNIFLIFMFVWHLAELKDFLFGSFVTRLMAKDFSQDNVLDAHDCFGCFYLNLNVFFRTPPICTYCTA